jgi:hypothetical protein
MSNHTPGPWTVSGGTIRNLHGHLVADFHSTDADGLLLAAAPELLAALKNLVASRPAFRTKPLGGPGSVARIQQEHEIRLEDEALAVIAKAL